MNIEEIVPIILATVGPLLTLLSVQWKNNRDTNRILNQIGLILYDRDCVKKLYLHLAADDPLLAASERRMLEKRIEGLESIITLIGSKGRLEEAIQRKIESLNTTE